MVVGSELSVARGTRIGRLARVDASVALEVTQLGEALPAIVADVTLLRRVDLAGRMGRRRVSTQRDGTGWAWKSGRQKGHAPRDIRAVCGGTTLKDTSITSYER